MSDKMLEEKLKTQDFTKPIISENVILPIAAVGKQSCIYLYPHSL